MSKLTLTVPTTGELNTVAEPKVDTALSTIQTWANGEIEGTNNLKAEGVTETNLDSATKTLLNTKSAAALSLTIKNEAAVTAATGELIVMEKNASVVTLPEPTLNRIVGVFCSKLITSIEVKCTKVATTISGDFFEATACKLTGGQHLLMQATGGGWVILAGEPKREQTYEATKSVLTSASFTPSTTRPAFISATGVTAWAVGGIATVGSAFYVPPGQAVKNESGSTATVSVLLL